jgi:hypothetical protein
MYDSVQHFKATYGAFKSEFGFSAQTPEALAAWQAAFRPRLRQILGLDNLAADLAGHQPTAQLRGSEDMGDYIRESWHIWVEPTVPLPFYLLRPLEIKEPVPLVIIPHGHNYPHIYVGIARTDKEAAEIKEGERDIGVQAVREGYIAIAPTTRAFGETRTEKDREADKIHSCQIQLRHGLLVGRTPIGERVWDMGCLIDWAETNQPIDPKRIAMTGNSGGGTVTVFAAACDTRIAVAMPGCYFCTFEGSLGTIGHCDCNYVPGILRLGEMYDVAGLIAPRPFNAISGRTDPIFPLDQVELAYEKLRHIYDVAGAADRCRLYIGEGGHRYYKDGAWPFVREYFA